MSRTDYDILIVGGGLAGASLAIALRHLPVHVGLIEAISLDSRSQPSYDDRSVALAYGSKKIFESMGVWSQASLTGATPIREIHISDRGRFGFTRLSHRDAAVEALGWVVENRVLGAALGSTLKACNNVDVICPASVEHVEMAGDRANVSVRAGNDEKKFSARLVVAADGGRSILRDSAGFDTRHRDFGQTAVVTNVSVDRHHNNVAYERFTRNGPLAFLPMSENRCSVVWTLPTDLAGTVHELNDRDFLQILQSEFGTRLGLLARVGRRHTYPLSTMSAAEPVKQRMVLIGNAAHTVHPVAGQGFNLGLRDVAVLAEHIARAVRAGGDPGDRAVLVAYAAARRRDVQAISTFTTGLVRLFSNDSGPLSVMRNSGLIAVDLFPPAKRALLRLSMGLAGRLPRLARGLLP